MFTCSLCKRRQNETVFHFVAVCPILKSIRKKHLGKFVLNEADYFEFLNGRDWRALGKYMNEAWKYRWRLTQEFNF